MYIEQTLFHVDEPTFVAPRFILAVQQVIDRQESLCAAFYFDQRRNPVQAIARHAPLPLTLLDWQGLTVEDQRARLADLMATDRLTDFDFTQAP